ncbi:MAG: cytochrome P460 family protein [Longimicrobiales bacterium]|nr:cytochrome P460 family protein [Longimicrobiales bacterium]
MRIREFVAPVLFVLTIASLACTGGERTSDEPMEGESEPSTSATSEREDTASDTVAAPTPSLPDTTAQDVWGYLQEVEYRDAWAPWPGMGRYYSGGEPHGRLLTTYVNAAAGSAIESSAATMPEDAVIVKENFMPDSTLVAVTVMYKHQGYAPDAGDWFWAKYAPDGSVDAAGRVTSCQECHVDGNDYVLTDDFGADTAEADASGE